MSDTLYVKPLGEAAACSKCGHSVPPQWGVFKKPDGRRSQGPFDTRGEAKQAALDSRTTEAVVLLRADGSVHSEMRPAVVSSEPGPGQTIEGEAAEDGD